MARDFFINGPSMVYVRGRTDLTIASTTELGLTDAPIRVRPQFRHRPIKVDAWGDASPEVQFMLGSVDITISLIHFDRDVLDVCLRESMAGATSIGGLPTAGTRLGNNKPLFHPGTGATGNHFVQLSISSPIAGKPWRFFSCYMNGVPMDFPLGVEKSAVVTNWTAIPYDRDLYNGGVGSQNVYLWDHVSV
jgi:hypothetical protein